MKRTVFDIKLSRSKGIEQYLSLLNGLLRLSPKELKILAEFIKRMDSEGFICTKEHRKEVKEQEGIKNVDTYVKVYADKKLIIKEDMGYKANPIIVPQNGLVFNFKWV